jgi:glycolate oxidase FAD binding subunit
MLEEANARGQHVVPRGGGTKLDWQAGTSPAAAVLSTARLGPPIEHAPGDLIATLPAGAALDDANKELGRAGQWLPLDPPFSKHATIGGIVAANDSGPRRHRHGSPRDLIIGIEIALADGRTARAGGRVVKNVAGYDLARLLCGSYGSLAVVMSATFKLAPLPQSSTTIVAEAAGAAPVGQLVQAVHAAPLTPSAVELRSAAGRASHSVMIRFETTSQAAERQAAAAAAICERHGARVTMLTGDDELTLWRDYETELWERRGTLAKISVLATQVGATLDRLADVCDTQSLDWRAGGRAALGVLIARVSGSAEGQRDAVTELRRDAVEQGGSLVILSSDSSAAGDLDRWGNIGDALPVMRAIKARFDPKGILNPGCGPWG